MQFVDAVSVTGTRRTGDGYLVANARSVRTGIQLYAGAEVGMADKVMVRVYRPPEEVFDKESLQSFSHAPVTVDHPSEAVTASNWRHLSVGEVSTAAQRDGEWVSLPLILKDAGAIRGVESGKRQLSAGYVCELDAIPGLTADGQAYDAVQRRIRINHLALVDTARAGPRACIGDSWAAPEADGPSDLNAAPPQTPQQQRDSRPMKTHLVDGHPVEMSDAAVVAVTGLQKTLATAIADNLKLTGDLAAAVKAKDAEIAAKDAERAATIKAKDTELATKDAEIETLKASQVDDAKLDALTTARADVIGRAKAVVADVKTDGLAIPAIRRAVVFTKLGDAAVKDKSDDYIEARFDILTGDANGPDPLRNVLANAPAFTGDAAGRAAEAQAKRIQALGDAWKDKAA